MALPAADLDPGDLRLAGLRYSTDASRGITREGAPGAFRYRDPEGHLIEDEGTLERIRRLAVPPAWTAVWICPDPRGHLQATGRDARGRKQYRYHQRWREVRDEDKYGRMPAFARALPRIRRRYGRDLARRDLSRERILAAAVALLDNTYIRIGNREYVRQNASYGLTTLRSRHVHVRGNRLSFSFQGKSGKAARVTLASPRLARVIRRMQDLPGQELFRWVDERGELHGIDSSDVNEYIREAAGGDFTAKDFRTWAGTMLASAALGRMGAAASEAEARRNVRDAVVEVAARLGNTPAVCRRSYIHPEVLAAYLEGAQMAADEAGVVALLRRRRLGSGGGGTAA